MVQKKKNVYSRMGGWAEVITVLLIAFSHEKQNMSKWLPLWIGIGISRSRSRMMVPETGEVVNSSSSSFRAVLTRFKPPGLSTSSSVLDSSLDIGVQLYLRFLSLSLMFTSRDFFFIDKSSTSSLSDVICKLLLKAVIKVGK